MSTENLITLNTLCQHYNLEITFFTDLKDLGLIAIQNIEQTLYVHQDAIYKVEKIVRIHQDLEVNVAGIDVILNLLNKIELLQKELTETQNSLRLYQ
ncbi:chaperone modulator CbpM [Flavobacterium crassostreae]|uniref:MerR family transcriptional regulator n=1 Tax=Flavobacterium crassostreae TaxID=1763534 RepID=A0A1B9E2G3_9FLAO|nr:chaperone modulator CbpM [Flavobacterium crassostreae]OCB76129.1 MerR family transcriptional regulator [Flavobacterium crassostreae]